MADDLSSQLQTPDQVRITSANSSIDSGTRAAGNLDLPAFFSLLYNMIKIDAPQIVFAPAYPKYLRPGTEEYTKTVDSPTVKLPVTITYRITRREPSTTGGNKEPFGSGYKERTPHERMRIGQADGTQTVISGQNFDNEVKFEIWAITNFEAEQFVNWFEHYLRSRRAWLVEQGIGEILFQRRVDDPRGDASDLDNKLEYRCLYFFLRTEELTVSDDIVLKNLEVSLGLSTKSPL